MLERQEVHRLARAAVVVPDDHTVAGAGVLGVHACVEGIVVDTPVTVDGGLVTSRGSNAHIDRELGLAKCGMANVTFLPGLEADASHREAGVDSHSKGSRGGKGLWCVSRVYTSECVSFKGGITLEKCILIKECGCLAKKVSFRIGKASKRVSMV